MSARRAALALPLALASLALGGCRRNACEDRPAEAQIDIVLRAPLAGAHETEVALRVGDGPPLVRVFPQGGSVGFVFELRELDRPPRQLRVSAVVRDADGRPLATGALHTPFAANGCNFFSVELAPLRRDGGAPDAGPDPRLDAAAAADADAAAGADAAADADADTTAGADAAAGADADTTADADAAAGADADAPADAAGEPR